MAHDEHDSVAVAGTESALTTSRKSTHRQQIEVITRGERRRSWSMEQKRAVVAESLEPGVSAMAVARRHGISTGQLYTWRHQVREEQSGDRRGQLPAQFARVAVLTGPTPAGSAMANELHEAGSTLARTAATRLGGAIEIALPGGVSIRVDTEVDSGALRRVLAALTIR
jgi:transposase